MSCFISIDPKESLTDGRTDLQTAKRALRHARTHPRRVYRLYLAGDRLGGRIAERVVILEHAVVSGDAVRIPRRPVCPVSAATWAERSRVRERVVAAILHFKKSSVSFPRTIRAF